MKGYIIHVIKLIILSLMMAAILAYTIDRTTPKLRPIDSEPQLQEPK